MVFYNFAGRRPAGKTFSALVKHESFLNVYKTSYWKKIFFHYNFTQESSRRVLWNIFYGLSYQRKQGRALFLRHWAVVSCMLEPSEEMLCRRKRPLGTCSTGIGQYWKNVTFWIPSGRWHWRQRWWRRELVLPLQRAGDGWINRPKVFTQLGHLLTKIQQ